MDPLDAISPRLLEPQTPPPLARVAPSDGDRQRQTPQQRSPEHHEDEEAGEEDAGDGYDETWVGRHPAGPDPTHYSTDLTDARPEWDPARDGERRRRGRNERNERDEPTSAGPHIDIVA